MVIAHANYHSPFLLVSLQQIEHWAVAMA